MMSSDRAGKVMVGTVTGKTRCIGTRSRRRFFFNRRATAVVEPNVLGVGFCASCSAVACVGVIGNGVGCLCRATALNDLSITTLQCHRFSAPCASVSSRGLSIALRSGGGTFARSYLSQHSAS